MKVVIAQRDSTVRVVDLPAPGLTRGCALVKVTHAALTLPEEAEQIRRADSLIPAGQDGVPLGAAVSGVIETVGEGVRRVRPGFRVAAFGFPYVYHASQLVVPENLLVELPKKVNHEEGAFAGQGAAAVNALRRSRLALGEVGVVLGADLPGLILAQVLRAAGVVTVVADVGEFRLGKAKSLNLPHVVDAGDADGIKRAVESASDGYGADAVFVPRPRDSQAVAFAASLLGQGGRLVLGAGSESVAIPAVLARRHAELVLAEGTGPGQGDRAYEAHGAEYPRNILRWTQRENMACFCSLLAERKVQVSPLITDRMAMDRAPVLYDKIQRSVDGVYAGVLTI